MPGFPVLYYLFEFAQAHVHYSVVPFNSLILCCPLLLLPSIFPLIGSLQKSWLFASDGQSTRASASATVLPINIQALFLLGLTALISLLSKRLSVRVFSSTTVQKHPFFWCSAFFMAQLHIHTWKSHSFDYTDLCQQSDVSAF